MSFFTLHAVSKITGKYIKIETAMYSSARVFHEYYTRSCFDCLIVAPGTDAKWLMQQPFGMVQ
jgi:hypothetical protein